MRGTRLNPNFSVTDGDRKWSVENGYPLYLPDQFLSDFREYFLSENAARPVKKNWRRAFRVWIRAASPSGSKYNPRLWEMRCNSAKDMESRKFERRGEPQIETKKTPMPEATRKLLEKIRRDNA